MSRFVVIREAGPGWADGRGALDQPDVARHSAFMDGLAERGVVLLAGPLACSEIDRIRALVVVEADDEAAIDQLLADDPWTVSRQLRTVSVEPWNIFVGADRLAASPQPPLAYSSAARVSNS